MSTGTAHNPTACKASKHARVQHLITADEHSLVELQALIATLPICSTGRVFIEVPDETWIGRIDVPAFMHCPHHLVVVDAAGTERIDCEYEGTGLQHEVTEVQRCLAEGLTESPLLPLAETLQLAATMDEVRARIGLTYLHEEQPAGP